MFKRSFYDSFIKKAESTGNVVIFKGVRGSGKTCLAVATAQSVKDSRLIFIDFDKEEWNGLKGPEALKSYLKKNIDDYTSPDGTSAKTVVVVAEAQNAVDYMEQLEFVQKTSYCQIYATVSRGEIEAAPNVINMYPMSFAEYMEYYSYNVEEKERYFSQYLSTSGFMATHLTGNPNLKDTLLEGIRDSIYLNDVILTGAIKNEEAFSRVLRYVMENIGTYISAYNISKEQTAQGNKIASDTVDGYLNLMCDCNITDYCVRYDIRKKELLKTNGRYYTVDFALRDMILGRRSTPTVNVLKNVVYYQLKKKYESVLSGWNPEVDFIGCNNNSKSYFFVDVSVEDKALLDKYTYVLSNIRDNYPKYILTLDNKDYSYNGIIHKNIIDFLLDH